MDFKTSLLPSEDLRSSACPPSRAVAGRGNRQHVLRFADSSSALQRTEPLS